MSTVLGMPLEVYLLVDLPPRFAVNGDLLGTQWDVGPGCVVALPRRPSDHLEEAAAWLEPPALAGAEELLQDRWSRRRETAATADRWAPWGAVMTVHAPSDRVLQAIVSGAVAVVEYDGPADDEVRWAFVEDAYDQIERWRAAVFTWVEVLSGRLVARPGPTSSRFRLVGAQPEPLHLNGDTGRPERFALPSTYVVHPYYEPSGVTLADWTEAVARVRTGEITPPLAHRLLRDAHVAQNASDYRRAVIDAATACEVALSDAIRAIMAASPTNAVDALVDRLNAMMDLFDAYTQSTGPVQGVSRKRLSFQLARPRNNVVHTGAAASDDDVTRALATAIAVVAATSPLLRLP
jgi:hypothetical protein